MDQIKEMLKGKKTNLQALGAGIVVALYAAGIIEQEVAMVAIGVLVPGMAMSLGAKIDRQKAGPTGGEW